MLGPDEARHTNSTSFGPSSETIHIPEFLRNANVAKRQLADVVANGWLELSESDKERIENELSLSDLQEKSDRVFKNDLLKRVLEKRFEDYAVKRKEYDSTPAILTEDPECQELVHELDNNSLKHWPPSQHSIYYFHRNKRIEENALTEIRPTDNGVSTIDPSEEAIVTISYHSRITKLSNRNESWTNNFTRDAVYAFLSSQTLQDVYDTLECPSKRMPTEKYEYGELVGYNLEQNSEMRETGGIIMEDKAYGPDGTDWAEMVSSMSNSSSIQDAGQPLGKVKLSELPLKIQMPYWVLHCGNCHHCWLVESIRTLSPSEASNSYPIALHIARQVPPTCHHCGRNLVTLVVNGDTRLGESPSRICDACWTTMGAPKNRILGERVVVVPFRG